MKPQMSLPESTPDQIKEMLEQHGKVLAQISFGDGTGNSEDQNVDSFFVVGAFPTALTDVTIAHKLGRIPVGYITVKIDKAAVIFTGTLAATSTAITLKSSVDGTNATILLF